MNATDSMLHRSLGTTRWPFGCFQRLVNLLHLFESASVGNDRHLGNLAILVHQGVQF